MTATARQHLSRNRNRNSDYERQKTHATTTIAADGQVINVKSLLPPSRS
jgi:hypothetical protein